MFPEDSTRGNGKALVFAWNPCKLCFRVILSILTRMASASWKNRHLWSDICGIVVGHNCARVAALRFNTRFFDTSSCCYIISWRHACARDENIACLAIFLSAMHSMPCGLLLSKCVF